ncbi:hypothetical protein [Bhargavaea cecembensis]|uniref:hypothetical protein n=1 Tax=Bhargavaea cecembensis TaxID=394098 RepID=UPI00058E3D7C|nr:hypothetical protein [Bhargavaea cecembensis]
MDIQLLTKEELIERGYDLDDLERDPESGRLFVRTGEEADLLVPVEGLVYELDELDGNLLGYGEYADGFLHGILVDVQPGRQVGRIRRYFRGEEQAD